MAGSSHPTIFSFQFDHADSMPEDFRGILDIEIPHLLGRMIEKTRNVNVILGCCYSARMPRDPRHGNSAVPKCVPGTEHYDLSRFESQLQQARKLQGKIFIEGDPSIVWIQPGNMPTSMVYALVRSPSPCCSTRSSNSSWDNLEKRPVPGLRACYVGISQPTSSDRRPSLRSYPV